MTESANRICSTAQRFVRLGPTPVCTRLIQPPNRSPSDKFRAILTKECASQQPNPRTWTVVWRTPHAGVRTAVRRARRKCSFGTFRFLTRQGKLGEAAIDGRGYVAEQGSAILRGLRAMRPAAIAPAFARSTSQEPETEMVCACPAEHEPGQT